MASVYGTNRYEIFKNIGGGHFQPNLSASIKKFNNYAKNVRQIPNVVFKTIKSGFTSGQIGLSAQLNYVLGKADKVIDPSGDLDGKKNIQKSDSYNFAKKWTGNWANTAKGQNNSMHLIMSFPLGTNRNAVELIVRDTCEEILSQGRNRFEYIAATHNDRDHPHAHIIVNRRNAENEWFYLAQDHEFNYDCFKDSMVKHAAKYGIELANSSRLSRGIIDYPNDNKKSQMAMRGVTGTLKDFGVAPYKNINEQTSNKKSNISFYITVNTKLGDKTIWGKGLSNLVDKADLKKGDKITITHEGKQPVAIKGRNGETIQAYRNNWKLLFQNKTYSSLGEENGVEDNSRTIKDIDSKRQAIFKEANFYHKLSTSIGGAFGSLKAAFAAAGNTLLNGKTINTMENKMSETALQNEHEDIDNHISEIQKKLNVAYKKINTFRPAERPLAEQKYYNALGNIENVLQGEKPIQYETKANNSFYSDQYRQEQKNGLNDDVVKILDEFGINKEEMAARMKLVNVSDALGQHWLQKDSEAIATNLNLDLDQPEEREEAFNQVAEMHSRLMIVTERQDLIFSDKNIDEVVNQVRDLSENQNRSFSDNQNLVENLEIALGHDGVRNLQNGNISKLTETFKIDQSEAMKIAKSYVAAMRDQGFNMDSTEKILNIENDIHQIQENKNEKLKEEPEQETEKETETHSLGL